ncbi:hypothetical protein A2331_05860 [Candidatus Falkowbacteria bacterium RIFOXYB2_FULL_34_18]|uniref:FAD-binding FR-type domain-containing protein n=1 Tax=Candidatus Falkowbacteria bacterium RIFOXYD2_FULL_34_120 TaxID=1798007 RepID=A0A1F5TM38_9BACT|nr:MAG: hypothetical protein A2331_05860 [Candidatus Falkowbacteria bacterium RIFOXYB2_FULL_34_18]OGF29170.1 MAG: hypothetical protein A2500_05805 [Candidatus Falkowbacteria bacterium RIFOXYC12_FULL_34_55]OGF36976.1 MAG: hypothetical protein A2466_07185 [Candidatus Falkowbacteria bacterium RIFOXYC2_FULL_34_220]OGF38692.1 MAG: hypothetical protein A2515_01470 [Candidatus Falkowbacteria bacterium RIFOXYD12_FULL_34_57]OGF39926.1 MAG: hypothetical protein A2531_01725 [Candidatus Falkowbacteria bact
MKAVIKSKKEIAKGILLIDFIVSRKISFIPGQYFFITLINPPYVDEGGSMRHFTIVNSPHEKGIISMATKMRESAFKKSLIAMPVGSEVKIDQIFGDFILPKSFLKLLIFVAGGIGITPFISMLRYLECEQENYNITLVYANENQESAAFLNELQELEKKNKNFKLILTFNNDLNWRGEKRIINDDFLKDYFPKFKSKIFFISGPPQMVDGVNKTLLNMGVKEERIKKENFFGY